MHVLSALCAAQHTAEYKAWVDPVRNRGESVRRNELFLFLFYCVFAIYRNTSIEFVLVYTSYFVACKI